MTGPDTTSAAFFEAMYAGATNNDPWQFATSAYEQERYGAVMRALEGRRYRRAFEPGCSVGVLTERLAAICDGVEACDLSATAVAAAQRRCGHLPGVSVRCEGFEGSGRGWQTFDLLVLCEIGYYFTAEAWRGMVETMVREIRPRTVVLGCHWLGSSKDHLQGGEAVQAAMEHTLLRRTLRERHEGFLLESWVRVKG